jgi:hypothetical protein
MCSNAEFATRSNSNTQSEFKTVANFYQTNRLITTAVPELNNSNWTGWTIGNSLDLYSVMLDGISIKLWKFCLLLLQSHFLLRLYLTLKMDAICSSETSVDFHHITQHYRQKCRNLKPYIAWHSIMFVQVTKHKYFPHSHCSVLKLY